jgi:hypothetical protein
LKSCRLILFVSLRYLIFSRTKLRFRFDPDKLKANESHCRGLRGLAEVMRSTLKAVRVLLEAVRVFIEAVRKIIEAMGLFVEAVRVLVEAVRVIVEG